MPGEKNCGDMPWVKLLNDNQILFCLIDVAGHGDAAQKHAENCLFVLERHFQDDLTKIIYSLSEFSQKQRGLVIGLALINLDVGLVHYMGVGNIRARIIGHQGYRFVARSGVVGISAHHPVLEEYLLNNNDVLLMYSDGVSDQFDVKSYPQILSDKIELIPQTIIQRFAKNNDDASCIAARYYL